MEQIKTKQKQFQALLAGNGPRVSPPGWRSQIINLRRGSLKTNPIWIDVEVGARSSDEAEEVEADEFALELLTGYKQPRVLTTPRAKAEFS